MDIASELMSVKSSSNGHRKPDMTIGAFTITSTGLTINGKPTYEEWYSFGETLKFLESSIQFALGDWLNYAERDLPYGEKYTQAVDDSDYARQTLYNYCKVAAHVQFGLRRPNLSFSHHEAIAYLRTPDGEIDAKRQRYYLDVALKEGLSVKALKLRIKQDEWVERITNNTADKPPIQARVLQGDMLDILPTLNECFDLVIADPPYNVTEWEWDKRGDNFLNETRQWLEACLAVCKPAYNLFWFCSPQFMADIELVMRELKMPIQSRIVWHRRNMAMGSDAQNRFIDSYELIFHVGNRALNFPPVWGEARFDVQTFAAPQTNFGDTKMHPTQKPLDLIQRLVEFGSYPGDAVLDPFAGSGTTGAACSDTRSCVLIEKEDEYIHVISNRLAIIRE